jgi:hypothetical protein
MSGRARLRAWLEWTMGALVVVVLASSWFVMMRAARRAMYFEPTAEALARAAESRSEGLRSALVLVVAAAALAVVARRSWLVLLAIPGLVTGAALAVAPRAAAFLIGLVGTALTVPLVLVVVSFARDPLFRRSDDHPGSR